MDDDEKKQGADVNGYPVLGKTEDAKNFEDCLFVLAVGSSKNYYVRKKIFGKLGFDLNRFATIIHPNSTVSRNSSVGYGTVLLAGTRVMPNTIIGNHVLVLSNVYIGHDDVIQDFVTITNSVAVCGITTIKEGCYIGANSSIKERIIVGKWSLVGLGAVVLKDVSPFSVVVGNPGRVLKKQDPSLFDA